MVRVKEVPALVVSFDVFFFFFSMVIHGDLFMVIHGGNDDYIMVNGS